MRRNSNEFYNGWRVVLASTLGVGIGLTGAVNYTQGIFLGPLALEFGWTRSQLAAGALCLQFGYAVAAPFVGWLTDRVGARKVALPSLFGLLLGLCLMTRIGPNIASYYGLTVLLALLGCGTIPIVWTYAVNGWFQQNRGFALSLTLTGTGVASIVAPLGVNALIADYGWQAGYLGLAAFALLVVIPAVWFLLFEKIGPEKVGLGEIGKPVTAPRSTLHLPGLTTRDAFRTVRFWQLLLGVLCISFGTGALIVHLVPLMTDAGLSRTIATRIVGLMGVAIIVGRLSIGAFVDRIHGPYVAVVYLLFPVIGCLILANAGITPTTAILGVLTIGLAAGAEVDLIAFLTSRYFGLKSYGALYGWQLVVFALGAGIGPLFSGRIYDARGNYEFALYGAGMAFALGAALIGTLGRYPVFAVPTDSEI